MQASVVLKRRRGLRLLPDEIEPAVAGDLTVTLQHRPERASIKVANLIDYTSYSSTLRKILVPLFDARIVSLENNVLTISGIELSADAENAMRVSENIQIWECTLLRSTPMA